MAAALGTYSALTQSKPKRIEGHTSNVESPILYVQYITGTIGETTESGDTYIIPHKFNRVESINVEPLSATGLTLAAAYYLADAATITGPTQITTAATAGATSVVLTGASAIDDVYNGCFVEIRFSSGNSQIVKVTDYTGSSKLAVIDAGLAESIASTGSFYTVKGTLLTTTAAAATPVVRYAVVGTF